MKCRSLVLSALVGLSSFSAYATIDCFSGTGRAGYDAGFQSQYQVINHLWVQVHGEECFRLEEFIEAVDVPFYPQASGSPYLKCRDRGVIDGLITRTNGIVANCVDEAVENGEAVGRFNAKIYCSVEKSYCESAPISLAGLVAKQACKTTFLSYVNDYCPWKAHADNSLQSLVNIACQF